MRKYYAALRHGKLYARLAGPFDTKEEADRWVKPAAELAKEVWPHRPIGFMDRGALACESRTGEWPPGKLNDGLGI